MGLLEAMGYATPGISAGIQGFQQNAEYLRQQKLQQAELARQHAIQDQQMAMQRAEGLGKLAQMDIQGGNNAGAVSLIPEYMKAINAGYGTNLVGPAFHGADVTTTLHPQGPTPTGAPLPAIQQTTHTLQNPETTNALAGIVGIKQEPKLLPTTHGIIAVTPGIGDELPTAKNILPFEQTLTPYQAAQIDLSKQRLGISAAKAAKSGSGKTVHLQRVTIYSKGSTQGVAANYNPVTGQYTDLGGNPIQGTVVLKPEKPVDPVTAALNGANPAPSAQAPAATPTPPMLPAKAPQRAPGGNAKVSPKVQALLKKHM
jgi:hypothetical protein